MQESYIPKYNVFKQTTCCLDFQFICSVEVGFYIDLIRTYVLQAGRCPNTKNCITAYASYSNMSHFLFSVSLSKPRDYRPDAKKCSSLVSKTRMSYVKKDYDAVSKFRINIPTPVMAGVRTPLRQFASCVLVAKLLDLKFLLQYSLT